MPEDQTASQPTNAAPSGLRAVTGSDEDREIARQVVSMVLRDEEAAWEPVTKLIAEYRRQSQATIREKLKNTRRYLRAANRGAERNALALQLTIVRNILHGRTAENHQLKNSQNK